MPAALSRLAPWALVIAIGAPVLADDPPPVMHVKGEVVSVTGNRLRLRVAGGAVQTYVLQDAALQRVKDLKPRARVDGELAAGGRTTIVKFAEIFPAGPGPGPTPGPGSQPGSRRNVLVTCDLPCEVSVDFRPAVKLPAGGHATLDVEPGERVVSAAGPDGATWRQNVKVGTQQVVVDILLAGAARSASAAEVDAAAAAVVAGLADVRGAGSYVAWVLEKKAFGYHDVQLTVALQREATALKRGLEKLQALKAPDAQRTRAVEELARAAGEAAQYATLLTEAATTAQSEGTSFGKSAQMRGQALAHLPLSAVDAGALSALRAAAEFKAALSPDRWPDAGLPADAQDFALGAPYDGDTPPRLGAVEKGSPADALGLRAGDRVLSVDGRAVSSGWELKRLLRAAAGRPVQLEVEREGKREKRKATVPAALR
jgi:hypothetical protein